ncbi:MAG: hypothetical protein U1E45_19325 [Geminicoccaceae bacterium]
MQGLIDLRDVAAGKGGFKIQGQNVLDGAGRSVAAAGDVNGDGFADLIVGARNNAGGGADAGAAYVVFGKAAGFGALVDLDSVAAGAGGFKIQGQNANDGAGASVSSAGDVNGDGFDDVLVGAYGNVTGGVAAGSAYVVFGKGTAFTSVVDLDTIATGVGGFKIRGQAAGDDTARSVSSAGDVNGDGVDDLIVGADSNDGGGADAGAAYIVFGKTGSFGALVNLANVAAGAGGFKIQGQNGGDLAGVSVAGAGDVNGDGRDDLLVGAQGNVTAGVAAGAAYLVFGKDTGALVDLDAVAAGNGGFKLPGQSAGDGAGGAVSSAGDVNGDGYADLLIGAPDNDAGGDSAGAAYVVFGHGGAFAATVDLNTIATGLGGFKIQGQTGTDFAGSAVSSAGDVNGDGYTDLLVGAFGNDSGADLAGAAYLVYGKASGFGAVVDLDQVAGGIGGFKIQGEAATDLAGRAVSAAGDVNGDGYDDILVGAPLANAGATDAGAAYLIYGFATPPKPTAGADVLQGTSSADTIDLLAGNDSYTGLAGDDRITGNLGADWLRGGADDDTFVLLAAGDKTAPAGLTVTNFDLHTFAGVADTQAVAGRLLMLDTLNGGLGNDTVLGSSGADVVVDRLPGQPTFGGQSALHHITGVELFDLGGGNDVLNLTNKLPYLYRTDVEAHGGAGNDTLWTGLGDDVIFGDAGNDIISGGRGNDVMSGGTGNDTFGFAVGFGTDVITDFTQGQDKLRIEGLGPAFDTFAELQGGVGNIKATANGVQVTLPVEGAPVTVLLEDFNGTLTAGDFVFVT